MFLTILVIATLIAVGVLLAEAQLVRRLRLDRLAASLGPQRFVVGIAALVVGVIQAIHTVRALWYAGIGFSAVLSALAAACLLSGSILLAGDAWTRLGRKTQADETVNSLSRWAAARQGVLGVASFVLAAVILIRAL